MKSLCNCRLTQNCPEPNGLCCNIHDPVNHTPTMTTKHLLLPYQVLPPPSDLPKPLNYSSDNFDDSILPYISTVKERVHPKPAFVPTVVSSSTSTTRPAFAATTWVLPPMHP